MLLARGRPEGLQYADSDLAGAARSFWAIAVALPAFILLRQLGGNAGATPAHDFALDLLSYIIGWLGFALLSRPVVEAMGCTPRWSRFMVVWNWCNVVQYLLLVVAAVPGLLGAVAGMVRHQAGAGGLDAAGAWAGGVGSVDRAGADRVGAGIDGELTLEWPVEIDFLRGRFVARNAHATVQRGLAARSAG